MIAPMGPEVGSPGDSRTVEQSSTEGRGVAGSIRLPCTYGVREKGTEKEKPKECSLAVRAGRRL